MAISLTPKMREVLRYIQEREVCPTVREIMAGLGIVSTRRVFETLTALEERGYIKRRKFCARAIQVLVPLPSLRVVFDPAHFEERRKDKLAEYEREAA